jgi:hypothetical protein
VILQDNSQLQDTAERNFWVAFSCKYAFKMHNLKNEGGYADLRYLNRSLSAGAYPGSMSSPPPPAGHGVQFHCLPEKLAGPRHSLKNSQALMNRSSSDNCLMSI